MPLYDQHVHSRHSFDSETDPAANVEQALAGGLSGLTFTEHFDTHPDDWATCVYDHEAYAAAIEDLRTRFGRKLFIGRGIEICYQPDRTPFIVDFLDRHAFDLVILSVHYFGDQAIHRRSSWAGLSAIEGTRRYFEMVLDAARFCRRLHESRGRVIDVLGHLDVVKRYTHRFFGVNEVARFGDLLDEILATCLGADVIPEVNTSTLRQDLDETMPGVETIARYVRLGGRAVSLGSDAHLASSVGADFDRAVVMLRAAGIDKTAAFRGRERQIVSLG
jgi:histidinol-phosphatase (PHP family)